MKIYGITITSSDGNWLVTREDGTRDCAESITKLFTNKHDRLDYAVTQMKQVFAVFDFENSEDANEATEDDFELNLKSGSDICIQGSDEHYTFHYFTQDVKMQCENEEDLEYAKALWEEFGQVPIDENDCITCQWRSFDKGTNRFDIWKWVEDFFEISVAEDLQRPS